MSLTQTNLDGILPLIARGKVRDIYEVDANTLLFVATDRISAYDVIMQNGIPQKGQLLTKLSEFWFHFLKPYVKTHLIETDDIFARLPKELSEEKYKSQLDGRALLVRKYKLVPLEVIVRGYITGSAWKEYKVSGTVHGVKVAEGLSESEEFPTPIFTPSTKAEQGEHDENISIEQAEAIVGKELTLKIAQLAVQLYSKAKAFAAERGIIIADTKFEFGLDDDGDLVLVDEVLTPDSSRFWNAKNYTLGEGQDSYDKQFLRDWLTSNDFAGKEGVSMTEEIVVKSRAKYIEAYEALTGTKWE